MNGGQSLKIVKTKLLVVEGTDEQNVCDKIIEEQGLTTLQVMPIGGKNNFKKTLPVLVKDPDFHKVETIGIIRDADTDASGAFQSVCSVLRVSRISQPIQPLLFSATVPKTCIFIASKDNNQGSIESIFVKTISNQHVMSCVDKYFDCVKEKTGTIPSPEKFDVAKLYVYLASKPNYSRMRFGWSVLDNQWNLKHDELSSLIEFIKKL